MLLWQRVSGKWKKKDQKQSFADVLQIRCSWKFRKFHRKAHVLESLFNKVAALRPAVKFVKFLRTSFFTEHIRSLLLKYAQVIVHWCSKRKLFEVLENWKLYKVNANVFKRWSFLQKWLKAESCKLFLQKSSILDVWQGLDSHGILRKLSFKNFLASATGY